MRSGRYCLVKSKVTFWPPMPKEFEVAALTWHWIFSVNIPIGIAAAMLGISWSPPGLGFRRGADVTGAALVTSPLTLGVYAIVSGSAFALWHSLSAPPSR